MESQELKVEEKDVIAEETGKKRSFRDFEKYIIIAIGLSWAIFQLALPGWDKLQWFFEEYLKFPLPLLESKEVRAIHLAFGLALGLLYIPFSKKNITFFHPKKGISILDYILVILAVISALYLIIDKTGIESRQGVPILRDVLIGFILVIILLEATRRAIGPALAIIAIVFSGYAMLAAIPEVRDFLPKIMRYRGVSLTKFINQMTMSTEGIYGIPLDVSANIVFLFVLFGAIMEKAGAGRFFINVALSILGRYKGGPAKAAIVSSGLTGMISGSSIANIVTTGTFTIPLMKKVGYPAKKAAAIEVAASTDGQLMPPIMGAAAFIIAEYVNVPYIDVVKAAFIPAVVSYFALFYITHLEASKLGMRGLSKEETPKLFQVLKDGFHYIIPIWILIYELVVIRHSPELAAYRSILFMLCIMIAYNLDKYIFSEPKNKERMDKLEEKVFQIPNIIVRTFAKIGVFFLYSILVVIATVISLIFYDFNKTEIGVFTATIVVILLALIDRYSLHKKLLASIKDIYHNSLKISIHSIVGGFVNGSKNMIAVALATAAAGIIVGIVAIGIGSMITQFVAVLAQGNIYALLLITAIACLIIGMGLPTTATYIVMAALTAPIIVKLGYDYGLIIPLMASHLFCFYFGILADDTPPVGLAAYTASAIAQSEPIPTGLQGFFYDLRTAVIPFMFVFNTDLLAHQIDSWLVGILVFVMAVFGAFAFTSALQGWLIVKNKLYEFPMLILAAFILFNPVGVASLLDIQEELPKQIEQEEFEKLFPERMDYLNDPQKEADFIDYLKAFYMKTNTNGEYNLQEKPLEKKNPEEKMKLTLSSIAYQSSTDPYYDMVRIILKEINYPDLDKGLPVEITAENYNNIVMKTLNEMQMKEKKNDFKSFFKILYPKNYKTKNYNLENKIDKQDKPLLNRILVKYMSFPDKHYRNFSYVILKKYIKYRGIHYYHFLIYPFGLLLFFMVAGMQKLRARKEKVLV